jgi:hypothetical protein
VAGEKTAGVAVRTTAQQDEIKDRHPDAVLGRKGSHESFLVLVRQLLCVVQILDIDGMHSGDAGGGGNVIEQILLQQAIVAIVVIEGNGSFIGEENLPFAKVEFPLLGAIAFVEKRLGQSSWKGASRNCDPELIVATERIFLAFENVGTQAFGNGVNVRIAVKIWLFRHGGKALEVEICRTGS